MIGRERKWALRGRSELKKKKKNDLEILDHPFSFLLLFVVRLIAPFAFVLSNILCSSVRKLSGDDAAGIA